MDRTIREGKRKSFYGTRRGNGAETFQLGEAAGDTIGSHVI
jgi:hypothetical protein